MGSGVRSFCCSHVHRDDVFACEEITGIGNKSELRFAVWHWSVVWTKLRHLLILPEPNLFPCKMRQEDCLAYGIFLRVELKIFLIQNNFRVARVTKIVQKNDYVHCIPFNKILQELTFSKLHLVYHSVYWTFFSEPFESRLQTWCPYTPKYFSLYFLKRRTFSYIKTILKIKKLII